MCCLDALFMPSITPTGPSHYTRQSPCEQMTRVFFATISGSCAVLSAIGFLLSGNPVPLASSVVFGALSISILCPGPSWRFPKIPLYPSFGHSFGFPPARPWRHQVVSSPSYATPPPRSSSASFSTPMPHIVVTPPTAHDSRVHPETGRAFVGRHAPSAGGSSTFGGTSGFARTPNVTPATPSSGDPRITSTGRARVGRGN